MHDIRNKAVFQVRLSDRTVAAWPVVLEGDRQQLDPPDRGDSIEDRPPESGNDVLPS